MKLSQRLFAAQSGLIQVKAQPKTVGFEGWAPDRPALGNPGLITAKNVVPTGNGFRPFPSLAALTSALTARCQGAAAAKDSAGNIFFYAGDISKLYSLAAGTFSDISKTGGYTTSDDGTWEFAQFGSTIIATNFDDPVQGLTIGSGSDFTDLITSTNKPKARHVDIIGDFVVLGNTFDATDSAKSSRVWWGAINSSVDFDPAASTQSDYQDLPDGGWVQKILGGYQYGLVFQETLVRRMAYVGPPLIFQFDVVDRFRGTPIPNSIIGYGRLAFGISEDGFMAWGGGEGEHIGNEFVDREFWDNFDRAYVARVSAAIDPISKVVIWGFPGEGSAGGVPNKLFLYNWLNHKWAYCDVDHEFQFRAMKQGYTLDELDAFGNLDTLPFSLDSRAWTGGAVRQAAFDTNHKLGYFDGANLEATLETGEFQIGSKRATILGVRPIVDGGTPTVAVASRATPQGTATYGSAVAINSHGISPQKSEGRYHRVKMVIPASSTWTHAQGIEIPEDCVGAGGQY